MSYILDALRKADAERERDPATRGIHAQPVAAAPADRSTNAGSRRWTWALALAAAALAVAGWQVVMAPAAPSTIDRAAGPVALPAVVVTPQPVPGQTAETVAAPAVAASAVLPAAPAPVTAPAPAPAPTPAVIRDARKPATAAPAAAASAMAAASAATSTTASGTATPATATSPSMPPPAAATPDRVLAVAELPADVQRELPKLAISGGVYSDNPAQRMLIVNGQVFNEGAEPAPGVQLEQIRAKTAVLKFRGYRYAVAY